MNLTDKVEYNLEITYILTNAGDRRAGLQVE